MRYLTLKKSTLVKIAIAFCAAVSVLAIAITVPAVEIIAENFNSANNIWSMIQRLQEEE